MALSAGTRLGLYDILAPLGAGGMGEVYRAKDSKLGREVAIKVLPEGFTKDPERLARFDREARLLASLNHPSIASIYGLEESDGTRFLVLELVPGETLAERLAREPLNVEEGLTICRQVAEALQAAHEKGVIHRDLKPSNVKVTPEGKAKVLDFGLAKAFAPEEASPNLSLSPTLSMQSLRSGVILGTAAYMSPEQARGKAVDKRTDIWSFGCVLYESLARRQAFAGETVSDTLSSILRDEPDWNALPPTVPLRVRELLRKCLQKDRERRLHDIADARIELEEAIANPSAVVPLPYGVQPARTRERIWMSASALLLLTTLLLAAILYFRPAEEKHAVRAYILPPENAQFHYQGVEGGPVVVSPDGRRVAFTATSRDGKTLLWVRPINALSAQPLSGTDGAYYPFWSADSRYLGFFAGGKLKKIDASGGPPQTLSDAPRAKGGTWNKEGIILFAPGPGTPIYRVSAAGGSSSPVTKLNDSRRENSHRWPIFLPDGRHFLYLARVSGGDASSAIHVASYDGKNDKLLLNAASNPDYAQGHLLFVRESTLMAQPFDAKKLELTGDAFPIAEQVQSEAASLKADFSVSESGVLAYHGGSASSGSQLVWFDRQGKQIGAIPEKAIYLSPRISLDGRRLALQIFDPIGHNFDIWLHEFGRELKAKFTFDPANDTTPVWSPDGTYVIFVREKNGRYTIYRKPANLTGKEEPLVELELFTFPTDVSSDERYLAFAEGGRSGGFDLMILPLSGDRKPFAYLQTEFNEGWGRFSPNGRWMAYYSNKSGSGEVYISSFPNRAGEWLVSRGGGAFPTWRRDGKELYYLTADNKCMAAEIRETGSSLEIVKVATLFDVRAARAGNNTVYDVSADGKRFLFDVNPAEESRVPITLVVNWTADLKR